MIVTRSFLASGLLAAALLAAVTPARAQDGSTALAAPTAPTAPAQRSEELARARGGRPDLGVSEAFAAWLDVSIFGGDYRTGSFTAVGTQFGARIGIEREARMSVDWGFVYAVGHVAGTFPTMPDPLVYDATVERTEASNPVMQLDWVPWLGTNTRFSLGLLVAIPAAAIQTFGDATQAGPRNETEAAIFDASRTTHDVWLAMNGGWNAWRYQPERLAVALPLALLIDAGPVEVALEGALGVSVPVLGGTGSADGIVQASADVHGTVHRWAARDGLVLGARVSIAGYHLGGMGEAAQPALEPWARIDAGPGFVTVRSVLNFGDPAGIGTATGVWALHVGGGIATE